MGLPIVKTTDFGGFYKLNQNNFSELGNYIAQHERQYLYLLMGQALADLYISDLNPSGVPQTARFTAIHNAMFYEDQTGAKHMSHGIKDMLTGFIYFEFAKTNVVKQTVGGPKVLQAETAREASHAEAGLDQRYNRAIETFLCVRAYCTDKPDIYTEFAGVALRKMYFGGAF